MPSLTAAAAAACAFGAAASRMSHPGAAGVALLAGAYHALVACLLSSWAIGAANALRIELADALDRRRKARAHVAELTKAVDVLTSQLAKPRADATVFHPRPDASPRTGGSPARLRPPSRQRPEGTKGHGAAEGKVDASAVRRLLARERLFKAASTGLKALGH